MATYSVPIPAEYTFPNIKFSLTGGDLILPYFSVNLGASVVAGDVISVTVAANSSWTFTNVNSGYRPSTGYTNKDFPIPNSSYKIYRDVGNSSYPFLQIQSKLNNTVNTPWPQSFPTAANGFKPLIAIINSFDNKVVRFSVLTEYTNGQVVHNYDAFPFFSGTYAQSNSGLDASTIASVEIAIYNALSNVAEIVPINKDPYADAGDSTTGGGDGTFDGSSDPVPVPNLPSVGAQDSGFITLFAPTVSQMKDLAHYMWVNPLFDIETGFKKLFSDPMDCILGLSVVPVAIPTSGAKSVNIGNLVTSVTMNVASQQYIEVDCGTVTMDRYFGSYLDFEPYTKISLFLPYCGTHSLNMDEIAGKTIGIVYHIDILTGSCIAFVKCGDSVLYEFNGACGSNIPVNSLNFASTIENAIRIAVNIGTTVATAGASAPLSGANAAARETARTIGTGVSLAGSTAEGALSLKPNVSRSGALGGGVGILGHQIPYFIITRPRLCKPAKQDFFQGYPSFIQTTIGDLIGKGFTSFTNVIISGQYLTDEEENELESILESGVYL